MPVGHSTVCRHGHIHTYGVVLTYAHDILPLHSHWTQMSEVNYVLKILPVQFSTQFPSMGLTLSPMSHLAKVDVPSNIRWWTDTLQVIISLERERERMTSVCRWQNWKTGFKFFPAKRNLTFMLNFRVKWFCLLLFERWNIKTVL